MNDNRQKLKGEALLALAAIIWGTAFVFQKIGMDHIGPMTFTFFRFGIGTLAMIPVVLISDRFKKRKGSPLTSNGDRTLLIGALCCGVTNFIASYLQQIGIMYTTAGKAGFLTAMDMVMIPFLLLILGRKVHKLTWVGVLIGLAGMYLLCINEGFNIAIGDALCLGGALGFALQILFIDYYVDRVDPIKLALFEFAVTAILSMVFTPILETVVISDVVSCAVPLLYTAILEVCIAFTLEMVGLKYSQPAIGTVIMSFESVFAVLTGALILHEVMTGREITGCIIMLCAFIIAQIPEMLEK
ncbi:MAG: DMT family transporter [Eubacteriales bacterium]|nr:DMT family transporter [Eubacteriales bacterium]